MSVCRGHELANALYFPKAMGECIVSFGHFDLLEAVVVSNSIIHHVFYLAPSNLYGVKVLLNNTSRKTTPY